MGCGRGRHRVRTREDVRVRVSVSLRAELRDDDRRACSEVRARGQCHRAPGTGANRLGTELVMFQLLGDVIIPPGFVADRDRDARALRAAGRAVRFNGLQSYADTRRRSTLEIHIPYRSGLAAACERQACGRWRKGR